MMSMLLDGAWADHKAISPYAHPTFRSLRVAVVREQLLLERHARSAIYCRG